MTQQEYESFCLERYNEKPNRRFVEKLIEKGDIEKTKIRNIKVIDSDTEEILFEGKENDYIGGH